MSARLLATVCVLVAVLAAVCLAVEENKPAFGTTFDEIVVESSLTVRGKGASRRGKALEVQTGSSTAAPLDRPKRRTMYSRFPSSSSSQASSNSFSSPSGGFGASASQSSSQSFGPAGGAAAHSASQSYRLPGGQQFDVSFSSNFASGRDGPSFSQGHSAVLTGPDGTRQRVF